MTAIEPKHTAAIERLLETFARPEERVLRAALALVDAHGALPPDFGVATVLPARNDNQPATIDVSKLVLFPPRRP